MGRLDGKVAIVTGGARGQGATEVKLFAREGARVVFGDILDEVGRKVEEEVVETGGEATYLHLDVTSAEDWRRAVETAESRYGRLDILVNNAGIVERNKIEDLAEEEWDRTMDINAKGPFLGTKYAIPAMRRAGGGSIVNISSVAGFVASPYSGGAYGASKGAIRLFTKAVAIQYAPDKIRCNSVHPGPVETPMLTVPPDRASEERRLKSIPLGRIGKPQDIAYAVLYLASDESSFVTGSELAVDGGRTAE